MSTNNDRVTVEEAQERVVEVLAMVREHDYEGAHRKEDHLMCDFIEDLCSRRYTSWEEVARVAGEISELAVHVHDRWYG